jgi:hypothetical protein
MKERESQQNMGQSQQQTSADTPVTKNPNPRANENLDNEDRQTADSDDVGSEITDGEAG